MTEIVEILQQVERGLTVIAASVVVCGCLFVFIFIALIGALGEIRDELKKLNSDR